MKKFSDLCRLIAASILFTSAVAFAPHAAAISIYDAEASFSLTLTDVTDANGGQVTSGWSVGAFGSASELFLLETGVATATGTTSVVDPVVSLSIGSVITQSSTANGTATDSFAVSVAETDLAIDVANTSDQNLTFSFDFDIIALVLASGDFASASATVDMRDELLFVDILARASVEVGELADDASGSGIIQFTLANGQSNRISGFVDSVGEAQIVVPVPAAV